MRKPRSLRNFGIDYRILKVIMNGLFGVLAGKNLLFGL
jgi:hypothetical protein